MLVCVSITDAVGAGGPSDIRCEFASVYKTFWPCSGVKWRVMASRSWSLVLGFLLVACGGNPGAGNGDGGTSTPDGGSLADSGPTLCSTAATCGGGVCNPSTQECTTNLPCSTHGDCGTGGHCVEGVCEPNTTGGTCEMDMSCPDGESCVGGFCGCEGAAFAAEPIIPNMMIVLDRSGSMDKGNFGGKSKWEVASDALSQILTDYGPRVNFGLVLYSGDGDCGPGNVDVDVAAGSAMDVNMAIGNATPDGNTPIGDTLDALVGYSGLASTDHPNYILLLTDGEETCDGDGKAAVETLAAQTPEVKTFVVGFGGNVDEAALNDMATAGGTALSGTTKYYQADDAQQLTDAFDSIVGSVLSCSYALSGNPTNLDDLYVYFDGAPVDRDMTQGDGWDYDTASMQITFYGPACDALKSGSVTDLAIVYGCPIVPIE